MGSSDVAQSFASSSLDGQDGSVHAKRSDCAGEEQQMRLFLGLFGLQLLSISARLIDYPRAMESSNLDVPSQTSAATWRSHPRRTGRGMLLARVGQQDARPVPQGEC
jgi:hypothetical protein